MGYTGWDKLAQPLYVVSTFFPNNTRSRHCLYCLFRMDVNHDMKRHHPTGRRRGRLS